MDDPNRIIFHISIGNVPSKKKTPESIGTLILDLLRKDKHQQKAQGINSYLKQLYINYEESIKP